MAAEVSHAAEHAEAHPEPNYMGVWFVLFILTVAEVSVTFLPVPRPAMVLSLVIMALTKAGCVGAYFMHLKFERRTLAIIAVIPLILCGFLLFMLMPDAR